MGDAPRTDIDFNFMYDITYKDNSQYESPADKEPDETITTGSPAGANLADGSVCTTLESKSDWRFDGKRKAALVTFQKSERKVQLIQVWNVYVQLDNW